ncbi:hypothetical protein PS645_04503 [Pseudomonas fluorescens]|uniref:Uncharacterized protein n=1 Tax=Pseudomonas fluorescens TaxID=294 RepID=A0A5E6W8B5_PSEFL|nr:hypothetical protein PS645_04503 [Pseudomonas fluorescens]
MLPVFKTRLGGLHDFDMQSSGVSAALLMTVLINGLLMSFLDASRSLAEQVAVCVGLMIESVSTPLMV